MSEDSTLQTKNSVTNEAISSLIQWTERLLSEHGRQRLQLREQESEIDHLKHEILRLTEELERAKNKEFSESNQLTLNIPNGSNSTSSPQTNQSDTPSIDRMKVQELLSEIESCIALLEA